jgi:hypothetical protein
MPTGRQDISGGRGILHAPNKCPAPVNLQLKRGAAYAAAPRFNASLPHVAIMARPVLAAALALLVLSPIVRPEVRDPREHAALTDRRRR